MTGKLAKKTSGIQALLVEKFPEIQRIVPKHVTAERLARVALTAVNRSPALANCTPESVVECVMNAAQVGLEVEDGTGRAYMIPYGNKATLVIGYPGLLDLAWRSGQIKTIYTYPVFDGDQFDYSLGLEPRLEHVPSGETDAGKLSHVYAVARLKDDGFLFEVMTRPQVDAIRKRSKSSGSGPWVTDYVEMARKTVLRRICKMVPKSVELQKATRIDEESELGPFNAPAFSPVVSVVQEGDITQDDIEAV